MGTLFGPAWQAQPDARAAMDALVAALRQRHGDSIEAVVFYGSSLRSGDLFDGLVDLYVIVNGYRAAHRGRLAALANALLPPNVYYLQTACGARTVRCKYAVLSQADLRRATSMRWFESYVWGRFCQPVALAWQASDAAAAAVRRCLREACLTFLRRALPALPERGSVSALWRDGLALSYRTELRAEGGDRAAQLVTAFAAHYAAVTRELAPSLPETIRLDGDNYASHCNPAQRLLARSAWRLRTVQGKLLSVLRLLKALFTFEGGLDYIAWKLERHSGQAVVIPERVRRHPLLFVWPFMLELRRRGVFR